MVQVVGYTFNADTFCLECTAEYTKDKLKELSHASGLDKPDFSNMSLEVLTTSITDFEGNDLHPIFDTDEQLDFDAVCSCGEVIQEITYHGLSCECPTCED